MHLFPRCSLHCIIFADPFTPQPSGSPATAGDSTAQTLIYMIRLRTIKNETGAAAGPGLRCSGAVQVKRAHTSVHDLGCQATAIITLRFRMLQIEAGLTLAATQPRTTPGGCSCQRAQVTGKTSILCCRPARRRRQPQARCGRDANCSWYTRHCSANGCGAMACSISSARCPISRISHCAALSTARSHRK